MPGEPHFVPFESRHSMSVARRLTALVVTISMLAPLAAYAMDDYIAASSSALTAIKLCGDTDDSPIKPVACKQAGYDQLVAGIDKAFGPALAKAPATIKPLLKRDQTWFNDIIVSAAESIPQSDNADERTGFTETLRQRAAALQAIVDGFGRPGYAGRWVSAFGSLIVTSTDSGGYRVAIETRAVYGSGDDHVRQCKVNAVVKPAPGGWLTGTILADESKPAPTSADGKAIDASATPAKSPSLKMRRQGETLRVVVSGQDWSETNRPDCEHMWQITASYFASGKPDNVTDKADTTFVVPTFDCTRPETASEEEICSDPDLADNDQRLNRAWKALLPRLDEATRRALAEDQRGWVHAQAYQYPEFLHPAWEKLTSFMHFTVDAREKLNQLQRERIALIEGFDEKRSGIAGVWLAHNAIIKITADADGSVSAQGWKWDQGDWKAGCDYDIQGQLVRGAFRSDDKGKNPDTLERDRATLIVNRQDDMFAKKRVPGSEEGKCKRTPSASSTARLFPTRPSPDIHDFGSSIR
jgi:uncharacterized protein YecT (DUF1311 family)